MGKSLSTLKNGIITPLVKNMDGDKTGCDNYRGITIYPVTSKVFWINVHASFTKLIAIR